MPKLKTIEEMPELQIITEDTDPKLWKVIGSYLYCNDFNDIDILTKDIPTALKIYENFQKYYSRANFSCMPRIVDEYEFNEVENYLTFKNLRFTYYNGKYFYGRGFVNSNVLQFDLNSVNLGFKDFKTILKEIEKLKKRGFILESDSNAAQSNAAEYFEDLPIEHNDHVIDISQFVTNLPPKKDKKQRPTKKDQEVKIAQCLTDLLPENNSLTGTASFNGWLQIEYSKSKLLKALNEKSLDNDKLGFTVGDLFFVSDKNNHPCPSKILSSIYKILDAGYKAYDFKVFYDKDMCNDEGCGLEYILQGPESTIIIAFKKDENDYQYFVITGDMEYLSDELEIKKFKATTKIDLNLHQK